MRDLTDKQFRAAMERNGWTKPEYQFLGYWQHRSGLHASAWNYPTLRAALKALIAMGEKRDREAERARKATTDKGS